MESLNNYYKNILSMQKIKLPVELYNLIIDEYIGDVYLCKECNIIEFTLICDLCKKQICKKHLIECYKCSNIICTDCCEKCENCEYDMCVDCIYDDNKCKDCYIR
jgi:hypothetical protein